MSDKKVPDGARRGDLYYFDPDKLSIVGGRPYTLHPSDTEDGIAHPLWDARVRTLKADVLDDHKIKNVAVYGVRKPILARKEKDGSVIVIDGRHRVAWARCANRLLEREGAAVMTVPVVLQKVDDTTAVGIGISTNAIVEHDSPIDIARNIARRKGMGASMDQLMVEFGMSKASISNYLSLSDLHPELAKQLDNNNLRLSLAYELAKLPREDQLKTWERLRQEGDKVTVRAVKEDQRRKKVTGDAGGEDEDDGETVTVTRTGPQAHAKPSVSELRKILKIIDEEDARLLKGIAAEDLLRWVAGEVDYKRVGGLAAILRRAKVIE